MVFRMLIECGIFGVGCSLRYGRINVSGGLLDYVFEAAELVRDTGCTPDEAYEIVIAAHEYEERDEPETVGNVV